MQYKHLTKSLVAGGALALLGTQAQANTITVGNQSHIGNTWTYQASYSNGNVNGGEGLITIYDFAGYVAGSGSASNPLWVFSSANLGVSPADLLAVQGVFDDPSIPNLTFQYTGPDLPGVAGVQIPLGTFQADSTFVPATTDGYVTQDRALAASGGGLAGSFGTVQVPLTQNVPDSGATLALLGLGLVGIGALRRHIA